MDRIFIIDDEPEMCLSLSEILTEMNYSVEYDTNPLTALDRIRKNPPRFVITDVQMPSISGLNLLKEIKTLLPGVHVIVMTGYPSVEKAVDAMKYGAIDFLPKPLKLPRLLENIDKYRELIPEPNKNSHGKIGSNSRMAAIYETVSIAAKSDASVIITGESGTGKEHIAEMIHRESARRNNPFIKVNSAALSESLLESELFGHEKGAFTGAEQQFSGKFELAHKGTLFLDEIGDMSLSTQAKILRVLQEQEYTRLGGTEIVKTDIRFVAATNKDFGKLMKEGRFREDLYYRLSVIILELPALRERREDIPALIDHFRKRFSDYYKKNILSVDSVVVEKLTAHSWPGNIRELKNCMERAVIFCRGEMIVMDDLASQYKVSLSEPADPLVSIDKLTREIISDALSRTGGSKQKAADLLHIHRKTLYNKMKKLGML